MALARRNCSLAQVLDKAMSCSDGWTQNPIKDRSCFLASTFVRTLKEGRALSLSPCRHPTCGLVPRGASSVDHRQPAPDVVQGKECVAIECQGVGACREQRGEMLEDTLAHEPASV